LIWPKSVSNDVSNYNIYVSNTSFLNVNALKPNKSIVVTDPARDVYETTLANLPGYVPVPDPVVDQTFYVAITATDFSGNENKEVPSSDVIEEDDLAPASVSGLSRQNEATYMEFNWDEPVFYPYGTKVHDIKTNTVYCSDTEMKKLSDAENSGPGYILGINKRLFLPNPCETKRYLALVNSDEMGNKNVTFEAP